jgi:hypothetical protein
VEVPETIPEGEISVVLTFSESKTVAAAPETVNPRYVPESFPTIEELKAEARQKTLERLADPDKDSMRKYAGCLAGSKAFAGDPVEIQRRMRNEWPDYWETGVR